MSQDLFGRLPKKCKASSLHSPESFQSNIRSKHQFIWPRIVCLVDYRVNEAWPVILFYKYVTIAEPERLAAGHRELCASLGLKGRLLVAPEGINGTLGGPAQAIDRYIAALHSDARFSDVAVKISHGDAGTFPKLVVKLRREIVALGLDEIAPEQHNQLSPADWKRMLEEDPNTVVLDVRNRFESDAGKFAGAIVCQIEHFRELPDYVSRLEKFQKKESADLLHGRDPLREGVRVIAPPRVQGCLPTARRDHCLSGAVRKRALAG